MSGTAWVQGLKVRTISVHTLSGGQKAYLGQYKCVFHHFVTSSEKLNSNVIYGQNEQDPQKVQSMYSDAVAELSVLRRSAIVNQLYGGWKLAVEDKNGGHMRGNT